jgi:tetratricopeptide (TPR) repeat protein
VFLGQFDLTPDLLRGGFNHLNQQAPAYDVYNASSNTVYAEANWWGSDGYGGNGSPRTYGSVDTHPPAWYYFGGLPKSVSDDEEPDSLELLLLSAYQLEMDSSYVEALEILNNIASYSPNAPVAYPVISTIVRIYNKLDNIDGLVENLNNLYSRYPDKLIGIVAYDFSVTVYAGEQDFDKALARSKEVVDFYTSDESYYEDAAWALFEQGLIYEDMFLAVDGGLGKFSGASALQTMSTKNFSKIINDYPESEAARLVRDLNKDTFPNIEGVKVPEKFVLYPAYPNPFNATTTIRFDLPEPAEVNLKVYDILGREVWSCNKKDYSAGIHSIIWDGTNKNGSCVSTGVYVISMTTPKFVESLKVIFMK